MRSELPPELSLGGEQDADDAGVAEPSGDPEVHVERPDVPDGPARPDPAGTRRTVLLVCAVVAALALVVVAWSSWRSADAVQEQACLNRAQMRLWASNDPGAGPGDVREALEECGLELPDPADDGGGGRRD